VRIRLPVAAKTALAMAGRMGGRANVKPEATPEEPYLYSAEMQPCQREKPPSGASQGVLLGVLWTIQFSSH
jgi:hypothetical protein